MKKWLLGGFAAFIAHAAIAQTSPNLVTNQVPTAVQWNSYFINKGDATNGIFTTPTLNTPTINNGALNGTNASSAVVTAGGVTQSLSTWLQSAPLGNATSISPGTVLSAGNVASVTGNTTLSEAFRATSHVTVEDFGAIHDCTTPVDDTAAFNAYATYLRGLTGYGDYRAFNLGNGQCYYVASSVNLTALSNLNFNGNGSRIVSNAAGFAALDALQSNNSTYQNFTLIGNNNLVGLQIGRPLSASSGSADNSVQNVFMDGTFTEAAIYNRASETTSFINNTINNRYNSSTNYGQIMDGDATWLILSQFAGTYNSGCSPSSSQTCQDPLYPHTLMSFNEDIVEGGAIGTYYSAGVWMSNNRGHSYNGTYVYGWGLAASPGAATLLSYSTGAKINNLTWDVHSEGVTITSDMQLIGTQTAPVINGLTYRNHIDEAASSVFSLGGSATSAIIHNFNLSIPQFVGSSVNIFDNGANWNGDGYAYVGSGGIFNSTWLNLVLNSAGTESYSGTLAANAALPSTIGVSEIANTGGVSGVALTNNSNNYLGGSTPTCTIAAPPGGGATASCAVVTVGFYGVTTGAGAVAGVPSGYAVNDVVTLSDGHCGTPFSLKVETETGGIPTQMESNSVIGSCPVAEMLLTGIATTGGSGTGLQINAAGMSWRILTANAPTPGSGYASPPAVSFQISPNGPGAGNTAVGTTTVATGTLALIAGGGTALNITGSGTTIAAAGTSPVTSASALVQGATKFTTSGCSISATTGTGTAGTYTSGTSGTCTAVITINGATGMTAPDGWNCDAHDWTTPSDAQLQTASSATTATIAGTTASGDVVHFACQAY